jgi:hypothetical protein
MDRHLARISAMGAHVWDAVRDWTSGAARGNGVELMSVHKRKYRSGKVIWFYEFDLPGSNREKRERITESGFKTKGEAIDAKAARRLEEQQKRDLAKAGVNIAGPAPKTLSMLMEEFFRLHVDEKLAPKTAERYH